MQSVYDDFPASSYAACRFVHLQFVKHPTLYCICMYILHSVSLYIYIAFAMSSFLQMAAYPNNGRTGIVAHPGSAFCLSLTLCGQLGSSNQSSLFILSYQRPVTYTFIIDPSVFTYDSALSFLVLCVHCYIGSCGVLVPMGRVHSYNLNLNLNLYYNCVL